jgi:hypothetical protein
MCIVKTRWTIGEFNREYLRLLEEDGSINRSELYERMMQGYPVGKHSVNPFAEWFLRDRDFWSFCDRKLFKHAKVFRDA